MPGVDFRQVRESISMAEVLSLLGFETLKRRGNEVRGSCPVHRDAAPKSTSFSANLEKNTFRCFHCGAAGNHLDLWAQSQRTPLYEAALTLCERLQHEIPWLRREPEKRSP